MCDYCGIELGIYSDPAAVIKKVCAFVCRPFVNFNLCLRLCVCGEMIKLDFFKKYFHALFITAICAAVVALLSGCHGKGKQKNKDDASPSDISKISDSDYYEYLKDYVDANAMSFDEIGETLRGLDIPVDDEVLKKSEDLWNKLDPNEMDLFDKVGFVISYVGAGSYDNAANTFTPSSRKVYCFNLENGADDVNMEIFFKGINSIGSGEFEITDVKLQIVSDDDKKDGVYNRNIKFKLNGRSFSYDSEIYYDWFDTNLIKYINEILKNQKISHRLYYMVENSTCEVFYCSGEWAEEFTAKTGCELRTEDM